jgi:hypothetical protein
VIRFQCVVFFISSIAIGQVFYCSDSSCSSRPIFIHGCIGNSDAESRFGGWVFTDLQSCAMVVNRDILFMTMAIS